MKKYKYRVRLVRHEVQEAFINVEADDTVAAIELAWEEQKKRDEQECYCDWEFVDYTNQAQEIVNVESKLRPDGWRKLHDLYDEWELFHPKFRWRYLLGDNVNVLVEAGMLERKKTNQKMYRVADVEAWTTFVEAVKKRNDA